MPEAAPIRAFYAERLKSKGDTRPFADDESLFVNGRLDSLDALEMVMHLESSYNLDFARLGFDLGLIDSVEAVSALLRNA